MPPSAWFAGPKAENGEWFADVVRRIVQDYYAWRRNYFPEDGIVLDSHLRRQHEPFQDAFEDRLLELLGRLKNDFPFQSPRYAAHMLAEQTLPAIAGYLAAMLYNPNNVSNDAAPVTVRLELEVCRMLSRMLGHADDAWAHLTGGGTVANIEALWVARTVRYLPFVIADIRRTLNLAPVPFSDPALALRLSPDDAFVALQQLFSDASGAGLPVGRVIAAYRASRFNVVEQGLPAILAEVKSSPVLLVPESHHYCFEKALDVLGLGRRAIVPIPVDPDFRMRTAALGQILDDLPRQGRHALAVVAVVGSTEEGAVDPVNEIVALREQRAAAGLGSFWLHADGAYGGYLRTMTIPHRLGLGEPRTTVRVAGREQSIDLRLPQHSACDALERLGECDSITIDPHKLGYIPYPAGAVCFRRDFVKPITRQEAPYLDEAAGGIDAERRSESIGLYILEGSKPGAAAAAVWLSHTLIPLTADGHGLLIRDTVRHAAELAALLERYASLGGDPQGLRCEVLCPPGSNIVCYAFRPLDPAPLADINRLNQAVYQRFTMDPGERVYDQRFFVSRTTLRAGQYALPAVAPFLRRLGVSDQEYQRDGVFLLRSVLMNPWYAQAKLRGRFFLSELVDELYKAAAEELPR